MPGSEGSEDERTADYRKQSRQESDLEKTHRSSAPGDAAGTRPDDDSDGDLQPRGAAEYGGAPPDSLWSKKLMGLVAVTHGLSLLLLIIITATRSWGVGKVMDQDISVGLFSVDGNGVSGSWSDFCNDAAGSMSAAGAICILTILLLAVSLCMLGVAFKMPDKGTLVLKVMVVLSHFIWLFLMIAWAIFASARNGTSCGKTNLSDALFYYWGWFFVLWMWLVHMVNAVIITMKCMGKSVCNF
eukprot:TRINITY_DN636_c6_g2_i1.p1 TRINITY_DN636_c6_g2~~TRINITY_DN636_c6_g2_i1.p1  ORF type:complete len:267 (+),score=91.75 TRINITY_DN636_c6_g2_i1:78-803(+)